MLRVFDSSSVKEIKYNAIETVQEKLLNYAFEHSFLTQFLDYVRLDLSIKWVFV